MPTLPSRATTTTGAADDFYYKNNSAGSVENKIQRQYIFGQDLGTANTPSFYGENLTRYLDMNYNPIKHVPLYGKNLLMYNNFLGTTLDDGVLEGAAVFQDFANNVALYPQSGSPLWGRLAYNINPGAEVGCLFNFYRAPPGFAGSSGVMFYAYCTSAPEHYTDAVGGYIFFYDYQATTIGIYYNGTLRHSATLALSTSTFYDFKILYNSVNNQILMYINDTEVINYIDFSQVITGTFMGIGGFVGNSLEQISMQTAAYITGIGAIGGFAPSGVLFAGNDSVEVDPLNLWFDSATATLNMDNFYAQNRSTIGTPTDDPNSTLTLGAQDEVEEGAQIHWNGAASYDHWNTDIYQNQYRFVTNSANSNYVSFENVGAGQISISLDGTIELDNVGSASSTTGISFWGGDPLGAKNYRQTFDSVGGTKGYLRANVDAQGSANHGFVFSAGTINDGITPTSVIDYVTFLTSGNNGFGVATPLNRGDFAGAVVVGSGYAGSLTAAANTFIVEGGASFRTTAQDSSRTVILGAIDGTNAGANILWYGAGANPAWTQDLNATTMYFTTNSASNVAMTLQNIGAGTATFNADAISTPVFSMTASPVDGYVLHTNGSGAAYWAPSGSGGSGVWNLNDPNTKIANYNITTTDTVIPVNTNSGSVTLTLPGGLPRGHVILVVDVGNFANTNNIIIDGTIPYLINGALSYNCTVNRGITMIYCNGQPGATVDFIAATF